MGLVVGEGCFTDDAGKSPVLSINLHEDDPLPLQMIQHLLGGRIYGPYYYNGRRFRRYALRRHALSRAVPFFYRYLPQSKKRSQFLEWAERHRYIVNGRLFPDPEPDLESWL